MCRWSQAVLRNKRSRIWQMYVQKGTARVFWMLYPCRPARRLHCRMDGAAGRQCGCAVENGRPMAS